MEEINKSYYYGGGGDAPHNFYQIKNEFRDRDVEMVCKWSATKNRENKAGDTYTIDVERGKQKIFEKSDGIVEGADEDESPKDTESSYASTDEDEETNLIPEKPQDMNVVSSKSPRIHAGEAKKFKIDDIFVNFIQSFTEYCEKRTHLIFDGPAFFDESCFPHNLILTDYVPVNVVAPKVVAMDVRVPAQNEYCKYGWCSNTLYEYFEDPDAFFNRDRILRTDVEFLLNTLQCESLCSFSLETFAREQLSEECPTDRMLAWNDAIASFISRHVVTLKILSITAMRMKSLSAKGSVSNTASVKGNLKMSFPKLYELSLVFWDSQQSDRKQPGSNEAWTPDWFPDAVDQYWISLMKSQMHGILNKLVWVSVANLDWNKLFQPILDANKGSLECLHLIEASQVPEETNYTSAITIGSSSTVLSCAMFKHLKNLRELSMRRSNCFLVETKYLPGSLEQVSIDDIKIKSSELLYFTTLSRLKVLRLAENRPSEEVSFPYGISKKSSFGVGLQVLRAFLNMRSLDELCVWGHRIDTKIEDRGTFRNAIGKMSSFIRASLCKSFEKVAPVTEPKSGNDGNNTRSPASIKFLKALKQIANVDEEFIVIFDKHK